MMPRIFWTAGLAVLLAACQPSGSGGKAPAPLANDPHLAMQQELETGGIDLSNLVVIRLRNAGSRVEVTSVLPAMIAETTVGGQPAKTVFRVNPAGDGLILFSRDILNGKSFRVDMRFAELEAKKGFAFPVVQPDGALKEQSFTLEKILRPDLAPA
ncbi:MAG: hypothetical protein WCS99_08680 [Limisphaerales bacterium]